jgi:alginate biosynthesis protein AlgK
VNREIVTLACVAAVVAGCTAPDLRRGKAELEAGDVEAAEAQLLPLAQLGYADAKMQLARVYARRADPESLQAAIALYRELLETDASVAVPLARTLLTEGVNNPAAVDQAEQMLLKAENEGDEGALVPLLELYSDHPERDKQRRAPKLARAVAELETPDAEAAVVKWYRRNALTDPKFAKELIRRCEPARERLPDCYVDLARHHRAAGHDKEVRELAAEALNRNTLGAVPAHTLERLAWSLVSEDIPGKPLPEAAQPMLKRAAGGSDTAKVRLARLLIEYPHLDPDGNPEDLLLKAASQGNPEASLALGRLYLDGKLAPADPVKATRHFEKAAAALPAANYYLGRIYKRGYLGNSDPVKAARYFLTAARSGYPRADQALAQLFSDNRGVRPNIVNAFVFASIAAEAETPEGALMLNEIRAVMKPEQIQEGERLLRQELGVRANLAPPPDPTAVSMQTPPQERKP